MKKVAYDCYSLYFKKGEYYNDKTLAVQAYTDDQGYPEMWGTITVNLQDEMLDKNQAYFDTNNMGDKLLKILVDLGICKKAGKLKQSGFCVYPLVEFTSVLDEYCE